MTTQQWIPLSGPGSRLPTEEDASDSERVYVYDDRSLTKDMFYWRDVKNGWTHWAPIPKAPPLPKPVELSQEEKDENVATGIRLDRAYYTGVEDIKAGIHYGRADGRKQLAAECLGLFSVSASLPQIENRFRIGNYSIFADQIKRLNELLTEAART